MLPELNDTNNAAKITSIYYNKCLEEFQEHLFGFEMGVAYGGGIEKIGLAWKNRGTVWGFDTFEGHPKSLSKICKATKELEEQINQESHATNCMDRWYNSSDYGVEAIKYDYIRNHLDNQNLNNVILVKGIVDENTDINFIPKLHYGLIDMDFPIAQWNGWNLVKNKFVSGGYLCLHDMIPHGHIHGNYELYEKMLSENLFDVVYENTDEYLCVLKKK